MLKILFWFLIIFSQSNWKTFTDVFETFSFQIPGEVSIAQDKFTTSIGEIEVITYQCKGDSEDSNLSYVLQEYDYPENYFPQDSQALIKRVLDTSSEEIANKMKGKIDYSRSIELNGYHGILFRITNKESKIVMKSKTYIIDGTYYSLQVYTKVENSLNDEIDFFLDSFRIIN
jgi:hypothetical protein